jgi:hypothetical protein
VFYFLEKGFQKCFFRDHEAVNIPVVCNVLDNELDFRTQKPAGRTKIGIAGQGPP